MSNVRILVVDDYPPFFDTLINCLSAESRFQVVGRAASGVQALHESARLHPDLVVMDVTMPFMDGLEATRRLKEGPNAPRVILLTMESGREHEAAALKAGADAAVFKYDCERKLVPAVVRLFPP